MESETQEQVFGAPDQSYQFQVSYEGVNFTCDMINASLVAPGGTA